MLRFLSGLNTPRDIMKWLFLLPMLALPLPAAETETNKPKPAMETFLDPAKAGQDYVDQGEYKNDWGGAQVIALGADKFRLVTYKGGLPGAGWGKETKQEVPGNGDGDKIVF